MWFKASELPEHAEPVSTKFLGEGEVYFSIQYADENLLIPLLETLVFAGRNLDNGNVDLLYFQDVESYRQGLRYGSSGSEGANFQLAREGKANHIFEYEHALNELMKCSLRRRAAGEGPKIGADQAGDRPDGT